jgi:cation diffusion facilitator family transporter
MNHGTDPDRERRLQAPHVHDFGTHERTRAERRTRWVIVLTAGMMVLEIAAGLTFGSMALLADGWHMGTHAAALGVTAFAYAYARRHAHDRRFSFGTGKVGALGGFASAVGLAVVAVLVFAESARRLATPGVIRFDEAIAVAALGLGINLLCAFLLRGEELHDAHEGAHSHPDHNLRGAYLHVLADALTSVLAIVALVAGKWLGWTRLDPFIGMVGALVIGRWSLGLVRDTGHVLLDAEISDTLLAEIRRAVETETGARVLDLHVWRVGPRHLATILTLEAEEPREPEDYKRLLRRYPDLVHVTVEVNRRRSGGPDPQP